MHRIVTGDPGSPSAPQGVGRVLPLVFGNLKGLLAIPLLAPVVAALRADFTVGDVSLKLDSLRNLNDLPPAGTVQLEIERIAYSSKDTANVALTGLVPGVDSTLPANHALGIPVTEVIPSHVFGFFENPQVFETAEPRFYHGGITALYVNGLLKLPATDPTHVVTNDDTAAIYDPVGFVPIHVGTARVDMTDPVSVNSPFANPDSVAGLQQQGSAQDQAMRDYQAQVAAAAKSNYSKYIYGDTGAITGQVVDIGGGQYQTFMMPTAASGWQTMSGPPTPNPSGTVVVATVPPTISGDPAVIAAWQAQGGQMHMNENGEWVPG